MYPLLDIFLAICYTAGIIRSVKFFKFFLKGGEGKVRIELLSIRCWHEAGALVS